MGGKQNAIVLKAIRPIDARSGVVRLSGEAERIVRGLSEKTNLSVKYIVSEIIIQAEKLIRIGTCDSDYTDGADD